MSLLINVIRKLFDLSPAIIGPPKLPIAAKVDHQIGPFKLRAYTPHKEGTLPLIIYFHGGGWIIGSIKSYDRICQFIAAKTNSIVISVDYRLAPEHHFPLAINDAKNAFNWMIKHASDLNGDLSRIAIAGDSAGANLAAVLANQVKANNNLKYNVLAQILIYPVLDILNKEFNYQNKKMFYNFFHQILLYCLRHYLKSIDEPQINLSSPLLLKDLSNIPETYLVTADNDILTENALKYLDLLKENDIKIHHKHYRGTLHGFIQFAATSKQAKLALEDICTFLKNKFWS